MTNLEADKFMDDVVKRLYPEFKPNDLQFENWKKRLFYYDYGRAKKCIEDFVFSSSTNYKEPPAGKIFHEFDAKKAKNIQTNEKKELNLLFEIVQDGRKKGQKFYQMKMPSEQNNIEEYAENYREKFDGLYGGNHYVIRHWENMYENQTIPF